MPDAVRMERVGHQRAPADFEGRVRVDRNRTVDPSDAGDVAVEPDRVAASGAVDLSIIELQPQLFQRTVGPPAMNPCLLEGMPILTATLPSLSSSG
jgi:hypothetical protein